MSDASREAIARQQLFTDINVPAATPILYSDNQAALAIAQNPVHHQRSKHIDIRYHFVRDTVQNDKIVIDYIPTSQQTADILTKALGPQLHGNCLQGLYWRLKQEANKGGTVGI